jgi:hypothetical protein
MPRNGYDEDLEYLRAAATLMRELGVLEYNGIKLAPPTQKPERIELTAEELYERQVRAATMRRDIQFAASSIKPILKHPPMNPDSVVQRAVSARERGSGGQEKA